MKRPDGPGLLVYQGGVMVSANFGHAGKLRFPLTSRPDGGRAAGGFASPLPAESSAPFVYQGMVSRQTTRIDSTVFAQGAPSAKTDDRWEKIQKGDDGRQVVVLVDSVRLTRECLGRQLHECCPGLDLLSAESLLNSSFTHDMGRPNIVILNMHGAGLSAPAMAEQLESFLQNYSSTMPRSARLPLDLAYRRQEGRLFA